MVVVFHFGCQDWVLGLTKECGFGWTMMRMETLRWQHDVDLYNVFMALAIEDITTPGVAGALFSHSELRVAWCGLGITRHWLDSSSWLWQWS